MSNANNHHELSGNGSEAGSLIPPVTVLSSSRQNSLPPLHRLGEVRREERVSRRRIAEELGITVDEVRRQECETTDLLLSTLQKWAKVLEVPVTELVQEPTIELSAPLAVRAHMIRAMRTALTILTRVKDSRLKRLAQTMADQLIEIMPELRELKPWPENRRRRRRELGIAFTRRISARMLPEPDDEP